MPLSTIFHRRSWHGPPPFSNFLLTNLFSIKFLYFCNISSLFPYFNLFVSIFIQSYIYVNIKLHVSTLLDTIIHKSCNSAGLKIVSLPSFCPCFCFVHTIAQFSRILRFSHIYCQYFRIRTHDRRKWRTTALTSTIGSEKFQRFII